jgi:hypothetical protein
VLEGERRQAEPRADADGVRITTMAVLEEE